MPLKASEIDDFFADRTVLNLIHDSREYRPLHVCYPKEIPVSRFVAWILTPMEGHSLGDLAIKQLLLHARHVAEPGQMDLATKRQIAPNVIATQSFTRLIVKTEVSLGAKGKLDILVLDSESRLMIAIENKFGAVQGTRQLKKYRQNLDKTFSDWRRIYLYLDSSASTPQDDKWISVEYEFFFEFLARAENSMWVPENAKGALSAFRSALDREGTYSKFKANAEDSLMNVAISHRTVLEQMQEWESAGNLIPQKLLEIHADTSMSGKQLARLFDTFLQRRVLWLNCIPHLSYAYFVKELRQKFPSLEYSSSRAYVDFILPNWKNYSDKDGRYEWAVTVFIRRLPDSTVNNPRYRVITMVHMESLQDDAKAPFLLIANELRGKYFKRNRTIGEDQLYIRMRIDEVTSSSMAVEKAKDHIRVLDEAILGQPVLKAL